MHYFWPHMHGMHIINPHRRHANRALTLKCIVRIWTSGGLSVDCCTLLSVSCCWLAEMRGVVQSLCCICTCSLYLWGHAVREMKLFWVSLSMHAVHSSCILATLSHICDLHPWIQKNSLVEAPCNIQAAMVEYTQPQTTHSNQPIQTDREACCRAII